MTLPDTSRRTQAARKIESAALICLLALFVLAPVREVEGVPQIVVKLLEYIRSTVAGFALGLWLISFAWDKRPDFFRRPVTWCLIALFVMLVVTSLLSSDPSRSLNRLHRRMGRDLFLAVAAMTLVTTHGRARAAYAVLAFTFVGWVSLSTVLYLSGWSLEINGRLKGFLESAVWYSTYLVVMMPIVFCGRQYCTSRRLRAVILAGLALGVLNLWWAGTRAALAIFLVSAPVAVYFALHSWRRRVLAAGVIAAIVVTACFVWPANIRRIRLVFQPLYANRGPLARRLLIWRPTWELIKDRPVTGYGYDARIFSRNDDGDPGPRRWVHNNCLQIWKEGGILSLGAYLAFAGSHLLLLIKLARNTRHRAFSVGLILSFAALMVTGVTENTFTGVTGVMLWMVTGLSIGMAYHLLDTPRTEGALNGS